MLLTFVCLAIGGGFFLVLSAVLGGDHEVHVDHDLHLDHDAEHDGGQGHHWLSLKVITGFCTFFGASGAIAKAFELSNLWCLGIAVVCGALMAVVIDALITYMYRQQSTSSFAASDAIGKHGRVTMAILPGSYGEVSVSLAGSSFTARAKGVDPTSEFAQGVMVEVVSADPVGMLVKAIQ